MPVYSDFKFSPKSVSASSSVKYSSSASCLISCSSSSILKFDNMTQFLTHHCQQSHNQMSCQAQLQIYHASISSFRLCFHPAVPWIDLGFPQSLSKKLS